VCSSDLFFGVQSLKAQVSAYEAAESSTKLALEATQLGYKVGVRVNLDVLNAQTQLYTTQRDLAKARYDVVVNGKDLGQFVQEILRYFRNLLVCRTADARQLLALPEEELAEMRRATALIVQATGRRPVGYRSPSWDFSASTLGFLRDEGFLYSSNLMDDDRAYVHPGGLVELPVQWMLDDAPFFLFRPPYSRPISPPEAALSTWQAELDAVAAEEGRCFVLTMHPQLSGRASRVALLDRLIAHARDRAGARFMRCADYAREVAGGPAG